MNAGEGFEADAPRRGRVQCGSLSVILLLILALFLCTSAIAAPWWDGPSSSEMFGEEHGDADSLSLWALQVSTEVHGHIQTHTTTWAEACDRGHGAPSAHRCHLVINVRWLTVMTLMFGVAAFAVTVRAVALDCCLRPSLKWFLGSAWLCLATALLNAIALLVAACVGTRDFLGMGTLAFSTALPVHLAASFTALYQAVVTALTEDQHSAQVEAGHRADDGEEAWEEDQKPVERHSTISDARVARHAGQRLKARLDHSAVVSRFGSKESSLRHTNSMLAGPLGPLEQLVLWTYEHPLSKDIPLRLMEKAFVEVDQRGEGVISPEDLAKRLYNCGLAGQHEAIDHAIAKTRSEGSGGIDRDEFGKFFRLVQGVNAREVMWLRRQMVDYFLCTFCCFLHAMLLWCLLMGFFRARSHYPKPEAFFVVLDVMRLLFILLSSAFAVAVVVPICRLTWGSSWRRTVMAFRPRKTPEEA